MRGGGRMSITKTDVLGREIPQEPVALLLRGCHNPKSPIHLLGPFEDSGSCIRVCPTPKRIRSHDLPNINSVDTHRRLQDTAYER